MDRMSSFCRYLLQKGLITAEQLSRAQAKYDSLNLPIGHCAYAFGFMNEPHIRKVLAIQQRTRQRFGEIAVSLGYLTAGQLRTVLRIQEKYRVSLEDLLVQDGALSAAELKRQRELFDAATHLTQSG
jgi:hypothetical protein